MSTGTLTPVDEQNNNEAHAETTWTFNSLHRCDRCGAQAYMRAVKPGTKEDLFFCGHHGNKRLADGTTTIQTLKNKGWKTVDQSARLYEHTKPDGGSAAG